MKNALMNCVITCLAFLAAAMSVQAADLTWNGGASGVWTNSGGGWLDGASAANWNNATPDSALFTGTTPTTVTLGGGVTVSNVTVSGANYVFSGAGTLTLSNTTWNVASGISNQVAWNLAGASTLTKTGAGTLWMGANTLISSSTHVVVKEGTMNLGQVSIASFTIDGGTVTTGGAITASNYYLKGGSLQQRLGAGSIFVTGGTTLLGSSLNGASNAVSIQSGTLLLGNNNRIGDSASVDISGGTLNISNFTDTVGSLVMSNGSVTGTGKLTATTYTLSGGTLDAPTGTGTMTVTNGSVTMNGASDANTINVNLGGTLTLAGSSANSVNATNIYVNSGGTLLMATNDRIGNATALVVDGGTFDLATYNETVNSVVLKGGGALNSSSTAVVLVSSNTYDMQSGSATARLGGGSIDVGLTKTTAGTVVLSASNTYVGTTTISEGVLRIAHANALGTAQNGTTVSSGAALEMSNGIAVGAGENLSLSGDGVSSGGALRNVSGNNNYGGAITMAANSRINSDAGTLTLDGAIGGAGINLTVGGAGNTAINRAIATSAGTFTKDGSGTVTLSGTNTYTGTTTVSAGALLINGNNAAATGAVSVASGATLGGSGTIGGATTVDGTLAPGSSPGVLTFTNGLTLNSSAITLMELAGTNGVVGTDFDQIKLTGGTLTYGGALTITNWGSFDLLTQPASYNLFSFSSKTGNFGSVAVGNAILTLGGSNTWTGSSGGTLYTFTENDGVLTAAVPEPSTVALLALGFGAMAFAGRRKIAMLSRRD